MHVSYSERISFLLTKNVRGRTKKKLKLYARAKTLSKRSKKRINQLYNYHKEDEQKGAFGLSKYVFVISYSGKDKRAEIDFDAFIIADAGQLLTFERAMDAFILDRCLDFAKIDEIAEFRLGVADAGDLQKGHIEMKGNERFKATWRKMATEAML